MRQRVGEPRQYSDRLLTLILRHHQPGQYGPDSRRDGLTPREMLEADRQRRIDEERERTDQMALFMERIDTMAERMAAHDPALDLSRCSRAEKLVHLMSRLWLQPAVAAGEGNFGGGGPGGGWRGEVFAEDRLAANGS